MKKIIVVFMIFFGVAAFGMAEEAAQEKTPDAWDSIKSDLKDAGNSLKNSIKSIAGGIKDSIDDETKEKAKDQAGKAGQAAAGALKKGAEKLEETTEKNKVVTVKGILKQGLFDSKKFTLEAEDGNVYVLKTISESDDSYKKLSAFKNEKISVSGVLSIEENSIKMASYKSAK